MTRKAHGFTLIELLIVVAIIAILAAIAVPNFLVAQTRAKVSRVYSDFRVLKGALEAYIIDANNYPETDFGTSVASNGAGLHRLTTPLSYVTSISESPFQEFYIAGPTRHSNSLNTTLYVRAKFTPPHEADSNSNGISDSYELDRLVYLKQTNSASSPELVAYRDAGEFMLKSVGPNSRDDRSGAAGFPGDMARIYDPTNGITSAGDIVTFRDTNTVVVGN